MGLSVLNNCSNSACYLSLVINSWICPFGLAFDSSRNEEARKLLVLNKSVVIPHQRCQHSQARVARIQHAPRLATVLLKSAQKLYEVLLGLQVVHQVVGEIRSRMAGPTLSFAEKDLLSMEFSSGSFLGIKSAVDIQFGRG